MAWRARRDWPRRACAVLRARPASTRPWPGRRDARAPRGRGLRRAGGRRAACLRAGCAAPHGPVRPTPGWCARGNRPRTARWRSPARGPRSSASAGRSAALVRRPAPARSAVACMPVRSRRARRPPPSSTCPPRPSRRPCRPRRHSRHGRARRCGRAGQVGGVAQPPAGPALAVTRAVRLALFGRLSAPQAGRCWPAALVMLRPAA